MYTVYRSSFWLQNATPQQKELVEQVEQAVKELVEQAATIAAQDNMELACAFIQKTAIEKAIPEIDKRLLNVSYQIVPQFFVTIIYTWRSLCS